MIFSSKLLVGCLVVTTTLLSTSNRESISQFFQLENSKKIRIIPPILKQWLFHGKNAFQFPTNIKLHNHHFQINGIKNSTMRAHHHVLLQISSKCLLEALNYNRMIKQTENSLATKLRISTFFLDTKINFLGVICSAVTTELSLKYQWLLFF